MAERSGRGAPAALIMGGAAAVAVALGGYALVRIGGFGSGQDAPRAGLESGADAEARAPEGTAPAGRESNQPLTDILLREAEMAAHEAASDAAAQGASDRGVPATADPSSQDAPAEPQTAAQSPAAPNPDTAEKPDTTAKEAAAETASPTAADTAVAGDAEREAEDFVLQSPELGLVRLDRDGGLVIAGRAQAGVEVSVLLDGQVLEQLQVPRDGQFVSLASVVPAGRARVISLLARHDGQEIASEDSFILTPVTEVLPAATAAASDAAPQPADAPRTKTPDAEGAVAAVTDGTGTAADPEAAAAEPGTEASAQSVAAAAVGTSDALVSGAAAGSGADTATVMLSAADEGGTVGEAAREAKPEADAAPATATGTTPAPAEETATAVAVLRAGADGVEVVQPAPLPDPALRGEVALDAISYSEAGSVELAGRAQPQSLVRIYIDNTPVSEIAAEGSGRWNGSLAGVAPGIYTLRVDEIEASSGDVLSRIETPFKREAPEDLLLPAPEETPGGHTPLVQAVTVQKGDTLWAISQEKFGSGFLYVRLFEANREAIRNPDLIYPGQVFAIPD